MHDAVFVHDLVSKLLLGVSRGVNRGKKTPFAPIDFREGGTYQRENTWKEEAKMLKNNSGSGNGVS